MTQENISGDDRTGCRPEQREGPGFAFKKPSAQILQACGIQNDNHSVVLSSAKDLVLLLEAFHPRFFGHGPFGLRMT